MAVDRGRLEVRAGGPYLPYGPCARPAVPPPAEARRQPLACPLPRAAVPAYGQRADLASRPIGPSRPAL